MAFLDAGSRGVAQSSTDPHARAAQYSSPALSDDGGVSLGTLAAQLERRRFKRNRLKRIEFEPLNPRRAEPAALSGSPVRQSPHPARNGSAQPEDVGPSAGNPGQCVVL